MKDDIDEFIAEFLPEGKWFGQNLWTVYYQQYQLRNEKENVLLICYEKMVQNPEREANGDCPEEHRTERRRRGVRALAANHRRVELQN